MAFDQQLAERVRDQLSPQAGVSEKKMFGGLAFLLNGNMCCGVHEQELIVRLDPAATDQALARPHTRIFDLSGGRPMKGWIMVEAEGLHDDLSLRHWIDTALSFAATLPRK